MARQINRRDFLASGLVALGAIALGPGVVRRALAAPAVEGDGPYGPLRAPDGNGLMLPAGFTSRVIATSGTLVAGTTYLWHTFPDGGATFSTSGGGWIYVSNSEVPGGLGGAGALVFAATGAIIGAHQILGGTSSNCAGGPTPWGTWLSCEETDGGRVWECDPSGKRVAVVHEAMGVFSHESAAIDPAHERLYLTEDEPDGCFYRFTPAAYPSLVDGVLEVAEVAKGGRTSWHRVPDPSASSVLTRNQVAKATRFRGGEGTWFDDGLVYFTTKGDNRVWTYDTNTSRIDVLYDAASLKTPPLTGVDNVMVSKQSGDVFIAEDGGDLDIVMITQDRIVSRLLKLTGNAHAGSEITGPALDPSGLRLYFSSQRANGQGMTFEVSGPFRRTRPVKIETEVLGEPLTPPPAAASPARAATTSRSPARSTPSPWPSPSPNRSPSGLSAAERGSSDRGGLDALDAAAAAAAAAGLAAAASAHVHHRKRG